MPYKEKRNKASKDSMEKKRKGLTLGVNKDDIKAGVNNYPAILYALTDPVKRAKLEKIYHSLNEFKVADKVYYGCGKDSVPFDVVGDLLEATR